MDPREQLLDTWRINARLNQYLLDSIPEDQLSTPLEKGKSIERQFAHIHNVRLMWLKAAAPDLMDGQQKLEPPNLTKQQLTRSMDQSAEAIGQLIARAYDAGGKVKNFKPHVFAFVGYFCAHEAYHRAHTELALRQAGNPPTDKVAIGLWEWGVR